MGKNYYGKNNRYSINSGTGYFQALKSGWNKDQILGVVPAHVNYLSHHYGILGIEAGVVVTALVWWKFADTIAMKMPYMGKVSGFAGSAVNSVGGVFNKGFMVAASHPFAAVALLVGAGLVLHCLVRHSAAQELNEKLSGIVTDLYTNPCNHADHNGMVVVKTNAQLQQDNVPKISCIDNIEEAVKKYCNVCPN